MLNEGLKHLEEDACAHGKGHLQLLDLGLAGSRRQRMVLNEHVGKYTDLEDDALNRFIHAAELICVIDRA